MRNAGRHPVEERHIAPLEDQPQLLPVHPAGLVEAVIEVHQDRRAVAHGAMDVLFDGRRRAGSNAALGRHHASGAQPAGEEVEEVHAVLDEDPAALGSVPEPVFARQVFIRCVVFKVSVQQIAQRLGLDQGA